MTPQYTFPLIHSMQRLNIFFITNMKPIDNTLTKNYDINIINSFISLNPSFFLFNKLLKPLILFFNYVLLLNQIVKIRPKIIHYNWTSIPFIDLMFIKIFKYQKLKIILTQHNYFQHSKNQLRFGEKLLFKNVDQIICLSKYVKNQFNKTFHKKISIIPHRNCYENLLKKKNIIKNNNVNLLLIGNIKKYKGIELMIDVMQYLKSNKVKIHLNILGPGNQLYINRINKKITKNDLNDIITLKNNFFSFNSFCDYINNCDIGLLPYKRASQSGIPYLYCYYNKPMIITNVGGLAEQIDTSFCNISEYDVIKFSNNIINMIKKIKNKKINQSSFENFLINNAWNKTKNEYLAEYKKYEN